MIDSHVHLNRQEFDVDRATVLARATAAGVRGYLNVGFDLPSSRQSLDLARSDHRILAAVGVHPHDAATLADPAGRSIAAGREILAELRELAGHDRVVAIGEIGLDFYRDLSPRPAQHAAFRAQLELAAAVDLPVVLHIRDAYPETLAVLDEVGVPPRGAILHSFAGEATHATWARERGCLLGIGGPVTYRGSRLPAVLGEAGVTADDVLLETDAPWLPPVPWRGKRNESAYLVHTRDALAAVLGVDAVELVSRTTASFARFCGGLSGRLDGAPVRPIE